MNTKGRAFSGLLRTALRQQLQFVHCFTCQRVLKTGIMPVGIIF